MSPLPGPRHKDTQKHVHPEPTTELVLLSLSPMMLQQAVQSGLHAAYLAFCLQHSAETEALLHLPHVKKGAEAKRSQRVEPVPGWGSGQ